MYYLLRKVKTKTNQSLPLLMVENAGGQFLCFKDDEEFYNHNMMETMQPTT